MKRQRTISVGKEAVDFMVLQYCCIDNSVLSTIGKHCKETTWKIAVGTDSAPIDIKLHVDKNIMSSPQVSVEWDGARIYPKGNALKEKLRDDFAYCVPFRGLIKGIGVKHKYEFRPEHGNTESWFPATLLEQRSDGNFALSAKMPSNVPLPDGQPGHKDVHYPVVRGECIRDADTKKPITVPRRSLHIKVPKHDPLHAVLSVDEGELITHFFARPTPPPTKDANNGASLVKPRILLKVTKDRQLVTSDVGYSLLTHFLKGDARSMGEEGTKWKKTWMLQLGPFAEHTIELEKRYRMSKVLSLSLDGDVLCEASAEDLESRPGCWECSFRLEGEKYLDWEVYETNVDGDTLDSKDLVRQKHKVCYECIVHVPEAEKDLSGVTLSVDDMDFSDLPPTRIAAQDEKISCAPEAMLSTFDLSVPHKINEHAPRGLCRRAQEWTNHLSKGNAHAGLLSQCCARPQVGQEVSFRPQRH